MVPEVVEAGKTSTMKKLELVVEKVTNTMKAVERLRNKLGIVAGGSVAAIAASYGLGQDHTTMNQIGQHGYSIPTGMDDEEGDDDGEDDILDPELS